MKSFIHIQLGELVMTNTRLQIHDAVIIEEITGLKEEYKHYVGKKMFISNFTNEDKHTAFLVDNIYHPIDKVTWPTDFLTLASEKDNPKDKDNPNEIKSGDRVRLLPYLMKDDCDLQRYREHMLPLVDTIQVVNGISIYAGEQYITFGTDGIKWLLSRIEKVQENDSKFQPGDKIINLNLENKSSQPLGVGDLVRIRSREREWEHQFPFYTNEMEEYAETIHLIKGRGDKSYTYVLKDMPYDWHKDWLEKIDNEKKLNVKPSCSNCSISDNPCDLYSCEDCGTELSNWTEKELVKSENIKGETNMTTKMTMIENAERTINEAIQAGSEGVKQGTANSAATTLVKVARNYFGDSYPKVMDTALGKKAEPLALALFVHFAVGMMGDKVPKRASIEKNCNRVITAQMARNSEEFIEQINPFLSLLSEQLESADE